MEFLQFPELITLFWFFAALANLLKLVRWQLTSSKINIALYEFLRIQVSQECLIVSIYWKNNILVNLRLQIHGFRKSSQNIGTLLELSMNTFGTVCEHFWNSLWTVGGQSAECLSTVQKCSWTVPKVFMDCPNCSPTVFQLSSNCSQGVFQLSSNCSQTVPKVFMDSSKSVPKVFQKCSKLSFFVSQNQRLGHAEKYRFSERSSKKNLTSNKYSQNDHPNTNSTENTPCAHR